jgi:aspartate 1-decarboxylase
MQTTLLKAKLHRARITHAELEYEGSCAIDGHLLDQAGIREYEQIQIYNVNNGSRITTYAIRAQAGSGVVSINGAAARHASVNDIVIICAYAILDEAELASFHPTLVYVDGQNKIARIGHAIPEQAA